MDFGSAFNILIASICDLIAGLFILYISINDLSARWPYHTTYELIVNLAISQVFTT